MIRFDSIAISFKTKQILEDFSYHVKPGDKLTIYGPSGSGKSSLLQTIAGITPISSGKLTVANTELTPRSIAKIRKQIGYLTQLADIPVENFDQVSDYLQLTENEKNTAIKLGNELDIPESYYSTELTKLSGGEKQRLFISSVLAQDKAIFLLDEPNSALDQKSTENLYQIVHSLPQTVISISHNQWWIDHAEKRIQL